MTMALQVAQLIHADLALSGASAWQWWLAVSNGDYKDGLIYTDWRKPGDPESIILSKTFWAMGNFSRFIRPGMQRIELTGDDHAFNGLLGSAYVDPASHRMVLVYVNASADAQQVRWTFSGASPPQSFTSYLTSDTADLQPRPSQPSDVAVEIPGKSVVSFVGN
jgi:O-glycosyl hydrolase